MFMSFMVLPGKEPLWFQARLRTLATLFWDVSSASGYFVLVLYKYVWKGISPSVYFAAFGVLFALMGLAVSRLLLWEVVPEAEQRGGASLRDFVHTVGSSIRDAYVTFTSPPIWKISKLLGLSAVFFLVASTYFYGTVRERVFEARGRVSEDKADEHNRNFGFFVSFTCVLCMGPFSWLMSKYSAVVDRHVVYYPVALLGVLWILCSSLVSLLPADAQYTTYLFFAAYRICWFGIHNQLIPAIYSNSPEAYTIFGLVYGMAGLMTFVTVLVDELVKSVVKLYWPVDVLFGGLSVLGMLLLSEALCEFGGQSVRLN
eukprot:TRINITY_DN314_c0_g1_i8.p1 TRINITY_DN314_c0_g1~~TRINITY_DN314_c0_g1_i8.p1  ORF type:complete len:315 (-),score=97.82 TRINITY_DN314_c0_g1_i8:35-979(-)